MSHPTSAEDRALPEAARRALAALPLDTTGRTASLAERMVTKELPSLSIAVLDGGEIAWATGHGVRSVAGQEPVTPRTLFQAASVSKPVTALAVMRLVQEGRLDLDADVNVYLRSWRVPANGGWEPVVTLRHLLSHTAGTSVHGFPGYRPGGPVPALRQILNGDPPANTDPIRVTALPGTIFRYSGGGTTIVQQVLEDVVGLRFAELMDDLVLSPLGMTESTFSQPLPPDRLEGAAIGHHVDGEPVGGGRHVYPEQAAAGLWTTPSSLLRVAREVQRAVADGAGAVLTRESAEAMLTALNDGPCGLGFFLDGEGATQRFSHGGGNEGFTCILEAYARRGTALAIMANGDIGFDLFPEIIGAVAREYGWPLTPGQRLGTYVAANSSVVPEAALVAACAGIYELRPGFALSVAADGESLRLFTPGQPPLALRPIGEAAFATDAIDASVRFARNEDGAVTSLTLVQSGEERTADRIG